MLASFAPETLGFLRLVWSNVLPTIHTGLFTLGSDDLLPSVNVVGCARKGRVGHNVHSKRGDICRSHDPPYGKRHAKLLAPVFKFIAEQLSRQRRVDESGRNEVDSHGCQFECEILRYGRTRGCEGRDEDESLRHASATGAAHEEQGPARAHLISGVSSDLQRQQQMGFDVATRAVEIEVRQRRIGGTRASYEHMVYRHCQVIEEPLKALEVEDVEGRSALCIDVSRGLLKTLGVPPR